MHRRSHNCRTGQQPYSTHSSPKLTFSQNWLMGKVAGKPIHWMVKHGKTHSFLVELPLNPSIDTAWPNTRDPVSLDQLDQFALASAFKRSAMFAPIRAISLSLPADFRTIWGLQIVVRNGQCHSENDDYQWMSGGSPEFSDNPWRKDTECGQATSSLGAENPRAAKHSNSWSHQRRRSIKDMS